MTTRLTPALIEIKRASVTATGEFTGYASTWDGQPDSYGDVIRRGAFVPALTTHKANNTQPAMLWSHDTGEPVGRWHSFVEDGHGLLATGKLTLKTKRGSEAYALLQDDAIALSVGFILAKDGATQKGGYREITKVAKLLEVSLVGLPANSNARITQIKKPETAREFERLLRDTAGFSARESKRAVAGGWSAFARDERTNELDLVLSKIEELHKLIEAKTL